MDRRLYGFSATDQDGQRVDPARISVAGSERMSAHSLCPHCGADHSKPPRHCLDTNRWTQAERDEWLRRAKLIEPGIRLAPSTREMADRFGERNRLDRERENSDA